MNGRAKHWMDRIGTRAMALVLLAVPATGFAQSRPSTSQPTAPRAIDAATTPDASAALDAAVFARFPELQTSASEARLQQLRADRQTARLLNAALAQLSGDRNHAALAEAARPLLEGLDETAAIETLTAILLAYYYTHLRPGTTTTTDAAGRLQSGADAMAAASVSGPLAQSSPDGLRTHLRRR